MFKKSLNTTLSKADFIVRSTFGVSLVAFCILFPFGVNNFVQNRPVDGIITMMIALVFLLNTVMCWRGKYSLLLNLFAIVPFIVLGSFNALFSLGVVGSYWSYLSVLCIYFILPLRFAKYASVFFFLLVSYAAYYSLDASIFARFTAVLIGIVIFTYISTREINKTQNLLTRQSKTDSLTGALNRFSLATHLERAIEQFNSNQIHTALCLIDIDHFKRINDTIGHSMGDNVLIELTRIIHRHIGENDLFFRIGGEEFLLLMNDCNSTTAMTKAQAIRQLVEQATILQNEKVTISLGLSQLSSNIDWKTWINEADKNLYLAKQNGRNKVFA